MKWCVHAATLVLVVLGIRAHAQVQEQLTPAEQKAQTIVTQPITIQKGFLRITGGVRYEVFSQTYDGNGARVDNVEKGFFAAKNTTSLAYTYDLSATFGITDRLQATAGIPYLITRKYSSFRVTQEDFNDTTNEIAATAGAQRKLFNSGIGDLRVDLQYQVIREQGTRPGVVLGIGAQFPTGRDHPVRVVDEYDYIPAVGSGETFILPTLLMRRINYPFSYSLLVDYRHSFGGRKKLPPYPLYLLIDPGFITREYLVKSPGRLGVEATLNFHVNEWIAFGNIVTYTASGAREVSLDSHRIEFLETWGVDYLPSIVFQIRRYRVNQMLRVPLMGKNWPADISFAASVGYTF